LDDFLFPAPPHPSPEVNAMTASQALLALAKVQLVADTLPQAADDLELLRMGNDRQAVEEFRELYERIKTCRAGILQRMSDALIGLKPEQSKS